MPRGAALCLAGSGCVQLMGWGRGTGEHSRGRDRVAVLRIGSVDYLEECIADNRLAAKCRQQ